MRSAFATILLGISLAGQPAAAQPATVSRSQLIGAWQCSVASITPAVSARLTWTARYEADGRYSWNGSSSIAAPQLPYSIVHEINIQGTWSLADDTLRFNVVEASTANVTQPPGMTEQETAALRVSLEQQLEMDKARSDLLGPSSARILRLSAEHLDLLDATSQDVFTCRPARPDPAQAR